jgi:hypothetical protein
MPAHSTYTEESLLKALADIRRDFARQSASRIPPHGQKIFFVKPDDETIRVAMALLSNISQR